MAALSLDLRQRILDAALAPNAAPETTIAVRFGVSRSLVQKLERRWRTHATAEPVGHRGGAQPKLADDDRAALLAWADGSDATGRTVNRALVVGGLTVKKRRSGRPSATGPTS